MTISASYVPVFSCFILLTALWLPAQTTVEGKLQNAQTGAPVIFAHIGVPDISNLGTISDEEGHFQLKSRTALPADQYIQFSTVGYQTRRLTVAQIQADPVIQLSPVSVELPEITVSDRRRNRVTSVGHYGTSQKIVTGWSQAISRGGLRTARMKLPGRAPDAILQQLRFHLAYNEFDSVLFRIHFFYPDDSGKLPGKAVPLNQDLFIHHGNTTGEVTLDLRPHQILVKGDFFTGIEVVRTYGACVTSECLHFSVVLFKDRIYFRNTSTDEWDSHKLGSPAIEVDVKY